AGDSQVQSLKIFFHYPYVETVTGTLRIETIEPKTIQFTPGDQTLEVSVPAVDAPKDLHLEVELGGVKVVNQAVHLNPVRPMQIFLLPHSHVDIGYTALQADVEKKQNSNIETGLTLARATTNYPPGAKFKWNVEVLWPVDNYLRDCTPEQREAFI